MSFPYISLCYHYIRPAKHLDPYPRLLGQSESIFRQHIELFKKYFDFTSLEEVNNFIHGDFEYKDKPGLLITFDDGLSDHYLAAGILAEYGIRAIFFVPTCILKDNLPPNPTIIHYALAIYGISKFLEVYRQALVDSKLDIKLYDIEYRPGQDDPWETIKKIKSLFKIKLDRSQVKDRNILLYIYKHLLLANNTQILENMHLRQEQITHMIDLGHSIGAHSRSHLSFGAHGFSQTEFTTEIIEPLADLKKMFSMPIPSLSYPFGVTDDLLDYDQISRAYKLAFTIDQHANHKKTAPLKQGRYTPTIRENAKQIKSALLELIS